MSDNDEEYNPRAHKSLLQAISGLGKSQHIRKTTRNEPQIEQNEHLTVKKQRIKLIEDDIVTALDDKEKPYTPVVVNDLTRMLRKTKKHLPVSRTLKNVQQSKKVLNRPLEKPVAERIKRNIGYEKTKTQLNRWDAVVAKNRSAETQIFPLPTETVYVNTLAHSEPLKTSFKSEMVREMEEIEERLKALKRQRGGNLLDPAEERRREEELMQLKLTREELRARRRELAYLKIKESQQSARARLRNKIKSKKYHKLLKRQKIQAQLKEFEALQKVNPDAALEKLGELEKNRVTERATLRHKNTGAWAKNLQVRAKYDKDVRKDLAEQLQISRELTQKKQADDDEGDRSDEVNENSDGNANGMEVENGEDVEVDPLNSWLVVKSRDKKAKTDNENSEDPNWRKYWLERNTNERLLETYKSELKKAQKDSDAKFNSAVELENDAQQSVIGDTKLKDIAENVKKIENNGSAKKRKVSTKIKNSIEVQGWIVEDVSSDDLNKEPKSYENVDIDDLFDTQEYKMKIKLAKELKNISKRIKKQKLKKIKNEKDPLAQLKELEFKHEAKRPIIDEELLDEPTKNNRENSGQPVNGVMTGNNDVELPSDNCKTSANSVSVPAPSSSTNHDIVDPQNIVDVKTKTHRLQTLGNESISDTLFNDVHDNDMALEEEDSDEDDDKKKEVNKYMTISEAFEDDDIIADFSRDKAKDSELKNAEIDLFMPGWGSWAGAGITPKENHKNKRLVLKLAPEEKRRDENKSGVFINEELSKKFRSHLVSQIPFPFTSVEAYEDSIRAPIGRSFVPETAFRMLTRPAVITKKGATIEPMDESELTKPARRMRNVVDSRIQRLQNEINENKMAQAAQKKKQLVNCRTKWKGNK